MVEVVAVIGAGASGLVASRHLQRCGFRPLLLEATAQVGGMWHGRSGRLWHSLQPNLSRYTQCFSDFPWTSVASLDAASESSSASADYPTRAQVQEYLDLYAAEHDLHPQRGCRVTRVERNLRNSSYQVTWLEDEKDDGAAVQTRSFEKVVIATGFFAEGVLPECLRAIANDDVDEDDSKRRVIHSSQYTCPAAFANQTVAVAGSAFSALEICADLCQSAKTVISVLPSVPWVMPRRLPVAGGSLPLDLALYRRKVDAPQQQEVNVMDEAACRARHDALQGALGTRKQASSIGLPPLDPNQPPTAVISDDYLNLVLSDRIQVCHGRIDGAGRSSSSSNNNNNNNNTNKDPATTIHLRVTDRSGDQVQTLTLDVDSVIGCTGYRSRLDFLDADILNALEYDELDGFMPLDLAWDALHPKLPGLGFVGMYRGAFFGVMELQARLLAQLWSGQLVQVDDSVIEQALATSQRIRSYRPRAQFPHFDVVGCMDRLASVLNLVPPKPFGAKGMLVTPSFYQPSLEYSQRALQELEQQVERGRQGMDMPKIVLSALIGKWQFERTIQHFGSEPRQERVRGTIRYSIDGSDVDTVRYREDGVFTLPNGRELDVFREYEYTASHNDLEIYFVEGGKRSYLFLGLQFQPASLQHPGSSSSGNNCNYWVATSDHLCIQDLYKGTFQVYLEGIAASKVIMTYRVKGPNKDYESVTVLTPLLV